MLNGPVRQHLMELLAQVRPENLEEIRSIVTDCGALDSVLRTVRQYIDRAVAKLTVLPESPVRRALSEIAQFVIDRRI